MIVDIDQDCEEHVKHLNSNKLIMVKQWSTKVCLYINFNTNTFMKNTCGSNNVWTLVTICVHLYNVWTLVTICVHLRLQVQREIYTNPKFNTIVNCCTH